ncbi:hypothetical protein BCY86_07320 [Pajaroellobacter abortibovis]|uniref:Rhodanese domain-containing protein n=1 Tax=Pajaroellobacter abortibovis TaxID=1882918 RepID=A0A1L6MZG5_9BACT|nr:hypothetical protein BCY86_07320 [Pajaroellobacter abortibovis]
MTSPGHESNQFSSIATVSEANFEQEVLHSKLPVLLQFWMEEQGSSSELEAFAEEMKGKVRVLRVDIHRSPFLARQLRVQVIPTWIVIAQGQVINATTGEFSRAHLLKVIEPFLPRPQESIQPRELAQLIKTGAALAIDTRDAAAFARARIPNAQHIPIEEIETQKHQLAPSGIYRVLYCRTGEKTKEFAQKLAGQGVGVYFLEGGILAWESENLPIERSTT